MGAHEQAVHSSMSCGGTLTTYTVSSQDDFPEHAALHEQVRDLQRQVNALKDIYDRLGGWRGWWLRFRLTRYLRTR